MKKKFLITGSAGFIGHNLANRLLEEGNEVVGLDNLCPYYDPKLKEARNKRLDSLHSGYTFVQEDLSNKAAVTALFNEHAFDRVFHLAAQAGVRYSLDHPDVYIQSNITGTLNILEACRHSPNSPELLFASSSSVYGLSKTLPLREDDRADQPVALYGATKRANELMAHSYSHLFGQRITALRFFTVYGPWGRPDMALFLFVKNILRGEPIDVYNSGDMIRDFTYIDDIVEGIVKLAHARSNKVLPNYDVFNIGSARPYTLLNFIEAIEKALGKKAIRKNLPFQQGDIYQTNADLSKINAICGYSPQADLNQGIRAFVAWYRSYYNE